MYHNIIWLNDCREAWGLAVKIYLSIFEPILSVDLDRSSNISVLNRKMYEGEVFIVTLSGYKWIDLNVNLFDGKSFKFRFLNCWDS